MSYIRHLLHPLLVAVSNGRMCVQFTVEEHTPRSQNQASSNTDSKKSRCPTRSPNRQTPQRPRFGRFYAPNSSRGANATQHPPSHSGPHLTHLPRAFCPRATVPTGTKHQAKNIVQKSAAPTPLFPSQSSLCSTRPYVAQLPSQRSKHTPSSYQVSNAPPRTPLPNMSEWETIR